MPAIPSLAKNSIEQLSTIIAGVLTHREIHELLLAHNMDDIAPEGNKQNRVSKAFSAQQAKVNCANNVLACVKELADPVRFINKREEHPIFLQSVNQVLIFSSLKINDDGSLVPVTAAKTLDEAAIRANSLRKKLDDRKVHHDVIACCRTELLKDNNYFHTVLEACKSVALKIRNKTSLVADGHELVDAALLSTKAGYPLLAINKYQSPSEQSEQKGFGSLVKGMFSMFRNPLAHDAKTQRLITEDEALEFLVLASLLHRKLDGAHLTNGIYNQTVP